jgi:hypothetical protein
VGVGLHDGDRSTNTAANTSRYQPAAGDPALLVNKIVVKQGPMINDVLEHMHEETGMLKYLYESSDEHIIRSGAEVYWRRILCGTTHSRCEFEAGLRGRYSSSVLGVLLWR